MKYKYKAYNKSGKKIKGVVEALDINEVKLLLKDFIIVDIKPVKEFNIDFSFKKVNKKELAKLLYTIGLYLKASIPLRTALKLTKNQSENHKIIKFLDYVIKEIGEGKSFYNAIEFQNIVNLPKYITNSIKVAEESGNLSVVLIEMSKFLKEEDKVSSKSTQALIYPAFIVFVAVVLVGFMLTNVVPKIVSIFNSLHQNLPLATRMVIGMGNFLKEHFLFLFTVSLIVIIIFVFLYKKVFRFRFFIHSLFLKIPVVKKIIISKDLGRFSYLVSTLSGSGVTFVNAVNLSSKIIENEKIKNVFDNALNEVIEGKKLSVSLKKAGFDFDKSFLEALALAEETSEIEEILRNLSEIYFEENEARINTLLSLIEPVLMIIVGGAVGFIVIAMLLPMFSMNMLK